MTNNIHTKASALYTSMRMFMYIIFNTSYTVNGRKHSVLINTYSKPGLVYPDKTSFSFPTICVLQSWSGPNLTWGLSYQNIHKDPIRDACTNIVCKCRHKLYNVHSNDKNIYRL